ncbi:MAG: KTSC domain-containing protein [Candidatus Margulisbacteria bacterium]|nr:KTSC domain-containing protein [Candidatus Margulisiibacteriota bacterium]
MNNINMIPVSSSNVAKIGYEESTNTLRVEFLDGSLYDYSGVPQPEFYNLKNASSVGGYLNSNIKGVYKYKKVR